MKPLQRFLIPVFVLAALALGAIGVAFARELSGVSTNTVTGQELEFTGTVESINGNTWIIDGRTVLVDLTTELKGFISAGQVVKVHASMAADGSLVASEIELADTAGVEDANANEAMDEDANDNEADDAFEVDDDNDNAAGVMDNANANDNSSSLNEDDSNDNSSSLNEDNSNDNSSLNDDNSNDNSSIGENDNSQGVSHDDSKGNDNH